MRYREPGMMQGTSFRGQPVLVLFILLGGWVLLRSLLWAPPFEALNRPQDLVGDVLILHAQPDAQHVSTAKSPAPSRESGAQGHDQDGALAAPREPLVPFWAVDPLPNHPPLSNGRDESRPLTPRTAAGHQLLLMAGFANVPLPPHVAALMGAGPVLGPGALPAAAPFKAFVSHLPQSKANRWSADGWLLLRKDTTTPVTSGRGSYGLSQLGGVLRYRLDTTSPHRPNAYVRASKALAGAKETEAALGLSARPVPAVPISVAGEARVTQANGKLKLRPAAYAVTELPPVELPLGLRGEAYAQAGYVGGDFATAFVDGQMRVDREVQQLGISGLRAGGGAWGGAQKGAARMDIGPGASFAVKLGGAPNAAAQARVAMDWRFRVAGSAEPVSGPTLTISAGF